MPTESVYLLAKRIDAALAQLLASIDLQSLDAPARHAIKSLRRNANDARLDVRDYEFAETRAEQVRLAKIARGRLEAARQGVLDVSQYNIISAVDVAALSASIDFLLERLQ